MDLADNTKHIVAVPYPGRGHVNPMMNLCRLVASRKPDVLITFVVTEEWLGFIGSYLKPQNIQFATIPNIIPSELVRGDNFTAFYEAVMTKMGSPFEKLLDQLELPVTTIIADAELQWANSIGKKRNIPVATLFTAPATLFLKLQRFSHIKDQLTNLLDHKDETVDQIQGFSSKEIAEFRNIFHGYDESVVRLTMECISSAPKMQYLLFNSVYELESQTLDALNRAIHIPIYPIGPALPYSSAISPDIPHYSRWLDSQKAGSVLYVSLGSFISVKSEQLDEIDAGLRNSSVPYLWVARGKNSRYEVSCGDKGMVVPWCDQLKVLCHSSVGGFLTHCGWNSTLEAVSSGIPMLTFPLCFDQFCNSDLVTDNWRIGWKLKKDVGASNLVRREEIAELVQRFMDIQNEEAKELRRRAKELQQMCREAIAEGGSSCTNLDAFIRDIL